MLKSLGVPTQFWQVVLHSLHCLQCQVDNARAVSRDHQAEYPEKKTTTTK